MAPPSRLRPTSSATAAVACLALLPALPGCGSDANDTEDAAREGMMSVARNTPVMMAPPTMAPAVMAPAMTPPAQSAPAPAANPSQGASPAPESESAAPARAQVFESCTHREGTYGRNCDSLYVTMKQASPARCVQLTIDNCGEYGRQGLGVELPMPWRLDSASVGSRLNECELGVFYPNSSVALRASGSISWSDSEKLPTGIVLDVSLETSSSGQADAIDVATLDPITPSSCDE